MIPSTPEVIQAYRHLFRQALHAVQYSSPARYVVRDQLSHAFRNGTRGNFNADNIKNTIEFLENATKESGLEHHILKNLLHIRWWDTKSKKRRREYVAISTDTSSVMNTDGSLDKVFGMAGISPSIMLHYAISI